MCIVIKNYQEKLIKIFDKISFFLSKYENSSLKKFTKGYFAKSAFGFNVVSLTPENVGSDSFKL